MLIALIKIYKSLGNWLFSSGLTFLIEGVLVIYQLKSLTFLPLTGS